METELYPGVARIEDLPYYYSPPMQFTFTQSATLTNGTYPWVGGRVEVGNNKNLTELRAVGSYIII